jgi:NAD(P)-dependent dehydrogenase (short-subunit alcohol dehydrogenase family)
MRRTSTTAGPLAGKTAFVAGGTRGMGLAIAQLLAENGAWVIACGSTANSVAACRRTVREKKLGIQVLQLDVSDAAAVQRAFARLAAQSREVDILVCCTGRASRGSALETSIEQWDRCMDANLRVPFVLSQAALPGMIARRSGLVVLLSSIWAVTATGGRVAYVVAKAALSSLARALAMDVAGQGVRVNAIAPGYIDTDFLRRSLTDANPGRDVDGMVAAAAARHPLGRIGQATDVAEAVLYLARSEFVTGQTLVVDGGITAQFALSDFARPPVAVRAASSRRHSARRHLAGE